MKKFIVPVIAIAAIVAILSSPNFESTAGEVNVPFNSTGKSDIPF